MSGNKSFKIGDCLVEQDLDRISRGSEAVTVRPQVMDVLVYLASRGGQIVHADELLEDLWPGKVVTSASVYNCITELRHAFQSCDNGQPYVDTVPKRGYRLVAPVTGLKKSKALASNIGASPFSRWLNYILSFVFATALAAALVYFVYDKFVVGRMLEEAPATKSTQVEDIGETDRWEMSVAVLPFVNMSDDPGNEYFSDGLSEEILTLLARVPGLKVIGRTSSFAFKGKNEDLRAIGHALGVKTVLEGSVRKSGERVRITAQLINVSDGSHIWSESYNRNVTDIFAVQDDVAAAIIDALQIHVGVNPARGRPAENTDAEVYTLWLKGNFHLGILTEDSFRRALAFYQEAIERDADYAPAYAGLAMAYIGLGGWHASGSPKDVIRLATKAAEQALTLDPAVAQAYLALGQIRSNFEWDWTGAERAFKQGIALNPSDIHGRIEYANFLTAMGRFDESIEIGKRTLELDPLSPVAYNELAFPFMFMGGRNGEALELIREGLEIEPDFYQSHLLLSELYLRSGDLDNALAHLERLESVRQTWSPALTGIIGRLYALVGRQTEARALLSQLMKRRLREFIPASALAGIYVGLREDDEALRWLEVAYEERNVSLVWLKEIWVYDHLRSDPRFQAILDRMDFPEP